MEVNFNTLNFQNNNQYSKNIYPCPSFKMKMNELHGIDQFVARKYKINPQPIKTLQEFQKKCKSFVEDIAQKAKEGNFGGRQQETQVQRKAMIKDWYDYVVKENGAYTGAMALMILGGITAGLKPKEDTLPPVLNKGVLANTVTNIQEELKKDEKAQLNFEKEYRLNLQKGIFREEKALDENLNGWIVIPSKKHDKKNFKANVDKLKMLSHDNWCTKSFNAEPYLAEGDFHVYMEKGKPKLGVRFVGDKIQEIQGELNNSKIPVKYGDIAKEHIKNYELNYKAKNELTELERIQSKIKNIQNEFPNGINNHPAEKIFEKLGIECKKDEDGFLTISHYKVEIDDDISFSDLGIDENKLMKNVKRIEGDAIFYGTKITRLSNLESIGGEANFVDTQISSLGNLKSIGGKANFRGSQLTSLGNLESIGGNAAFEFSKITSLGKLESIGENAYFDNSQITSLGNLVSIGGTANFEGSIITDLGNLESIGKDAHFEGTKISSLGNLKSIGGDIYIKDSILKYEDLASVKIGGDFKLQLKDVTGWIVIPSLDNDKNNFEANVSKLNMFYRNEWNTNKYTLEFYLKNGDFHVYVENGSPKLGVRFVGDKIEEVHGQLNDLKIPLKYEDIAKEHIKNYELSSNAENELAELEKTKEKVKEIQQKFPKGINNYPAEEIFKTFGIKCKKDKSILSTILENCGIKNKTEEKLIISHYNAKIDDNISFSDLGIDENKLIKNVKSIKGNANFEDSQITSLGNLKSIGGDVYIKGSKLMHRDFDSIKVGGQISSVFKEKMPELNIFRQL